MVFSSYRKMMIFRIGSWLVGSKSRQHYPATMAAIEDEEKGIIRTWQKPSITEIKGFINLAKAL